VGLAHGPALIFTPPAASDRCGRYGPLRCSASSAAASALYRGKLGVNFFASRDEFFDPRDLCIDVQENHLPSSAVKEGAPYTVPSFQAIRIMDDHMTAGGFAHADWFAAGHTTIADFALFPAFALSRDFGIASR
jgi:hypothetical protein